MSILLSIVGFAFAVAFCVWIMARKVKRHETWAKYAAVALIGVLVSYPLSLGPACRIADHWESTAPAISVLYRPLIRITWQLAGEAGLDVIYWYCCNVCCSGKIIDLQFVRDAGLH